MRPLIALDIEVHQPISAPTKAFFRPFDGRLKAAMYRGGVVHHFRVVDAGGVLWLVPPAWLPDYSLRLAEMAFDRTDALFLHHVRTLPAAVIWQALAKATGMPEGLTPDEMLARLEQRHDRRELVQ
jgi:hypothetical protein